MMKVGVVGCGGMGLPMAAALRSAGFDLRGLDLRPPGSFGPLSDVITTDPTAMADREVLFSVVRDRAQTDAALFETGLVDAAALRVLVICSTLSPHYILELPDRLPPHVAVVDAPMSGAPIAAQERRLSFMLGGERAVLEELTPALRAMGREFHHLGGLGAGMTAKVLNNVIAASSVAATRLAMDWGADLGLAPEALREVFGTSSGQTWFGTHFDDIAFAREGYELGNTMGILEKDLLSAIDAAPEAADVSLPLALIDAIQALRPLP